MGHLREKTSSVSSGCRLGEEHGCASGGGPQRPAPHLASVWLAMALAIKSFTARRAYRGITQHFSDRGRVGKTAFCPTCEVEYVLYYGQRKAEADTSIWLETELRRICPAHTGWLSWDETAPFTVEQHRQCIERAIGVVQRELEAVTAVAKAPASVRERLIFSGAEKEVEINELRQELE